MEHCYKFGMQIAGFIAPLNCKVRLLLLQLPRFYHRNRKPATCYAVGDGLTGDGLVGFRAMVS